VASFEKTKKEALQKLDEAVELYFYLYPSLGEFGWKSILERV